MMPELSCYFLLKYEMCILKIMYYVKKKGVIQCCSIFPVFFERGTFRIVDFPIQR